MSFAYKSSVKIGTSGYLRCIKDRHQMFKLLFSALIEPRFSFMFPVLKVLPFKTRSGEKSVAEPELFVICLCYDHVPEITA